jgi:hypothetical protein
MKTILILTVMMFSWTAFADVSEVPSYLKDAVITVKLKNGKEYTFSANTHAVVTRSSSSKKTLPFIVNKEKVVVEKDKSIKAEKKSHLNRVRVLGGLGPNGVKASVDGTTVVIKQSRGPVGGIGYDRTVDANLSIGGEIMTNGTGMIGVGVDF